MDFNYLLNYLKYSSFIQSGTFLFSLIPIFITLFLKRTALHNCTCKSNCYDYINFAAVSLSVCCALEFLNICLQYVHLLTTLNVWMTFNCNVSMCLLSSYTPKIYAYVVPLGRGFWTPEWHTVWVFLISGGGSDGPERFDWRKLITTGTQRLQDADTVKS